MDESELVFRISFLFLVYLYFMKPRLFLAISLIVILYAGITERCQTPHLLTYR